MQGQRLNIWPSISSSNWIQTELQCQPCSTDTLVIEATNTARNSGTIWQTLASGSKFYLNSVSAPCPEVKNVVYASPVPCTGSLTCLFSMVSFIQCFMRQCESFHHIFLGTHLCLTFSIAFFSTILINKPQSPPTTWTWVSHL